MLYLSRLTLNRRAGLAAIAPLLDPGDAGQAADTHHRLIWTLFGDRADRARDFLWRADGRGRFLVLSARAPEANDLFEPPEVKQFAPALAPGDRLNFTLRANATKTRKTGRLTASGKERKAHDDIVMRALKPITDDRAGQRLNIAAREAGLWIDLQGRRAGFRKRALAVEDYATVALPGHKGRRAKQPQFGILDLTGVIEITEPGAFLAALAQGFGRAKGYGCGLMLIRRA